MILEKACTRGFVTFSPKPQKGKHIVTNMYGSNRFLGISTLLMFFIDK